jgi:CheY-like chemotaxis protein/HPt (histidine-containing phosphotransfer) domain-containing protein
MESNDLRKTGYVDSLRMSAREHADILNELDAHQAQALDDDRRHEQRLRFSQQALLFVQIRHPGGTAGNYLVRTRNLSRTGIGFLHGSFVYTGTACTVALRSVDKAVVAVEGRVVRCNHVRGHVHEVGVHFDKPIRLRQFLGREAPPETADSHSSELPKLAGRVLCIDDAVADQDLLKFHLENLGLHCDLVADPLDALSRAESAKYDLVLTSLSLPGGMSGFALADALRTSGYAGPVIAMTADERDATRIDALQRGFASFLAKPYRFEDLLRLLLQHLTPLSAGTSEVLTSELWSDVAMRPLIRRFLQRLAGQSQEIQRLANTPGSEPVFRKLCTELKGSAGSYGYPTISQAAHDLLDNSSPYDLRGKLDALAHLCQAAANVLNVEAAAEPANNAHKVAGAA